MNRQRGWRRWKRRKLAGTLVFALAHSFLFAYIRRLLPNAYVQYLFRFKYQTCPMLSRHQSLWKMQSLGTEWNMKILPLKENCKIKFYCCQLFSLDGLANLEKFFVSCSFLVTLLLSVWNPRNPTLSRICIDNDPLKWFITTSVAERNFLVWQCEVVFPKERDLPISLFFACGEWISSNVVSDSARQSL
jgi:hypothetical protein